MSTTNEILGYKFASEIAAKNSQNALKSHFNLPVVPGGTSQWVRVHRNEGTQGVFYYFHNDPSIPPILGGPESFLIDIEDNIDG